MTEMCADAISRKRLKDEIQYYIDEAGWGERANEVLGWCLEFIDNQQPVTPKAAQPCEDAVSREAAVKIAAKYGLTNGSRLGGHHGIADVIASEIEALPSVTPKAPEPRVMTLEEVISNGDTEAMYLEHMDGEMIVSPVVLLTTYLDLDKDCLHFAGGWRCCGSFWINGYGKTWRCWTSRPTDAQREATPWV